MMNLIKNIKLHKQLRIRQEVLFNLITLWSQNEGRSINGGLTSPYLDEYTLINDKVRKIEKKIPNIYFFISDLFGLYNSIKKESNKLLLIELKNKN